MRGRHWLGPLAVAALVLLGACGSDPAPTAYSAENREAFIAACTDNAGDSRVVRDVCECTWDRIEANVALTDLTSIEESLRLDALTPLPDEVTTLLAECMVTESGL
ncbi:MAG: hypothetical protein AAF467_23485 [Actinomycetota bacterium]